MQRKWIGGLLILLVLTAAGCEQQKEEIKIGLAINLSGRGGAAGEHIRDGALLAVEEINGQGGVLGRPLRLLVRDDQNSDAGIKEAEEALLAEQVVAVIGHSYSSNTLKAYPIVTASDTLMITAYTATTELSGKDDLFFRTAIDCVMYGQKTAALFRQKGITSVAFLMDMSNPAFVLDYLAQVKKNFQGDITTVAFESRDKVDWPKLSQELLAVSPDAVMMLTESSMTGVAVQYVRNQGFSGPVIATIWTQSPELIRIGGPAAEGMSLVTFINPENRRADYLRFADRFQEKFQKPASARASRAYEMVYILAEGLRQAEKVDAYALKKALLSTEFESIMGRLRFDRYGDVVRPVYEVRVRAGRFVNGGEIP